MRSHDTWAADAITPDIDEGACRWRGELPRCSRCGDLARPNILMFSDSHWQTARYEAQEQRLEQWLAKVRRPVVVEIGAGTAIPSVRRFSGQVLSRHGGRLVRINPREADVTTPWDVGLACGAQQALEAVDKVIEFPLSRIPPV